MKLSVPIYLQAHIYLELNYLIQKVNLVFMENCIVRMYFLLFPSFLEPKLFAFHMSKVSITCWSRIRGTFKLKVFSL